MNSELKEKIEEIISGVFLHGVETPHLASALPENQYTISEAVALILEIIDRQK